jgi:hypothetical protein
MKTGYGLIGAVGLGAGVVYLLDGDAGKRPRAWLRERVSPSRPALDAAPTAGMSAADLALAARLQALLRRYASRPQAITVAVSGGVVTLDGTIREREVDHLVAAVARQPGVQGVDNRLALEPAGSALPPLTPATGALVGAGGGLLLRWAIARRAR